MWGMSPRPLALSALACTLALVGPASAQAGVDSWATQRLTLHGTPHVLSRSDVNPTRPPAALPAMQPLLHSTLGPHSLRVQAAPALLGWRAHLPVLEPEAERALRWLGTVTAGDPRPRQLVLQLVDRQARYTLHQAHPAHSQLRVELLLPMDTTPASRSVALAQGLALALHEASHALRPATARDRDDDEYRASLLAACYLIDGLQRGDRMRLAVPAPQAGDFTIRHSDAARARAIADLTQAVDSPVIKGDDAVARQTLLAFCSRRLGEPAH